MHIKFNAENKNLEWHKKKLSLFAKWAMQNKLDALVAAQIKRTNEIF